MTGHFFGLMLKIQICCFVYCARYRFVASYSVKDTDLLLRPTGDDEGLFLNVIEMIQGL